MKTTVKISKNRLYAPIDYDCVTVGHSVCGVKLTYTEYDFILSDCKRIVLFDAYSSTQTFKPFDVECGVVAFPFYCGCMTDKGERVAYCGLRFGEQKTEKWVPLRSGNVLEQLSRDPSAGGVPISSGVCALAYEDAYDVYRSHIRDEIPPLAGVIVLDGQTHTEVELYGKKYAVFSSGWGDGRYNCYAGMAADGSVNAIIVDFGMIDYPPLYGDDEYEEIEVDGSDTPFIYDVTKSELENNILRQTYILTTSRDPVKRMGAFARRGYAYHSVNRLDDALADYTSAMECAKSADDKSALSNVWALYDNAAEIYIARNDYDSAIKLMLDALDFGDVFYSNAFTRLIDLYQITKRTENAIAIAQKMVERRPSDPVAYVKYAECCVSVMDYQSAAQAYGVLADQFRLYENLFDEAACLIELGEYGKAVAALERHPAKELYEQYWYYKAYAEYKERLFKTAYGHAERAHAIDAEYMPALYLLIDIAMLFNDYDAVAVYAEKYKRLRPYNEYGYSVCADANLFLGNFALSADDYCYVYDHVNPDDRYAALAAIVCAKTGDQKRSRALLKKLRRKRSAYYHGAFYGIYVARFIERNASPDKVVKKLGGDSEFIVLLSMYMLQTGYVVQAAQLLDVINKTDLSFDVVAQQIRTAEKIGDRKHFVSFFNYYVDNFINPELTEQQRIEFASHFIANPRHTVWLSE